MLRAAEDFNLFARYSRALRCTYVHSSSSDVVTYGGVESGVALTLADRFGNLHKLVLSEVFFDVIPI
jgi:hypothetical protein